MNIAVVVAVIAGTVALGVFGLAMVCFKKQHAASEALKASLMEAQMRLEFEKELREKEQSDNETRMKERETSLREVMSATVEQAVERFKSASSEQLKTNGQEFAAFSKKSMAEILEPLRERIKEYDERADKVHQGNAVLGTELKAYVQAIKDSAAKIQSETTGFRNDLKFNNKFQGNFGEERLAAVLQNCGLAEGEDFVLQSGENQKIPDCCVYDHLAKKIIVIDSKMSWKSYSEGFATDDPEVREAALKEHVKSVTAQIDNLAGKKYYESKKVDREGYSYAPFSIMFVPSDGAMVAAIEKDPMLIQYAAEKNVYITSPLNLYTLLKLLHGCMANFDFAQNLQGIAKEAKNVVDRIDSMFAEFEALGKALRTADDSYAKVLKRLTEGSSENHSSILDSAKNMIALSVKHDKLESKAMKA